MSALDHALAYIGRGWCVTPVKARQKRPERDDWAHLGITAADAGRYFSDDSNIGVVLGDASGGLVDIDLDCPEAVELAPLLLPPTLTFGRPGSRRSHWLYIAKHARTEKFQIPLGAGKSKMLVELRANKTGDGEGLQTVFPGSVHESGEPIAWEDDVTIADVTPEALRAAVARMAAACALRRGGWELDRCVAFARAPSAEALRDADPTAGKVIARWLGLAPPAAAPATPAAATTRADNRLRRAAAYLAKIPGSVSGSGGHQQAWAAALAVVRGFDLDESDALLLMRDYNARCEPPWSDRELEHKVADAAKSGNAERGYLLKVERPLRAAPQPSAAAPDSDPAPTPIDRRPYSNNSYLTAVQIIERNDRDVLGGRKLEYNEMTGRPTLARVPILDEQETTIRGLIEARFTGSVDSQGNPKGLRIALADVRAAIAQVARANPYHPVREYLAGLTWDGRARLDAVCEDILGAERNELNQAIVRRFMVSAVARALRPGCQVDTTLILVGRQGTGKSSFFRTLAGEWFLDTALDITTPKAFMTLRRAWIYEWAELEVIRRAKDINAVKSFITSTVDSYVPQYGHNPVDVPRSFVVVGSTNADEFLVDDENRRFWPIRNGAVDLALLRSQRDQLWAEAVAIYRAWNGAPSETPWVLSASESTMLAGVHSQHLASDAWEPAISEWAQARVVDFTTADVLAEAIRKPLGQWAKTDEHRVAQILRRFGWRQVAVHGYRKWRRS